MPLSRALGALFHAHAATPDIADEIVLTLRLPRALAGFASGALLQVLLRNPLAEPYVLGMSGGAATFALVALLIALVVIVPVAPQLNVLLRGDATAHALGVPVARLRLRVYLVASLAAAAAVTTAGTIGFVGLVVPHLLRLAFGNDQRMLLPAAALAGGLAVMAADLAARTVIAPAQLPVGVVTALTGVPMFLWMLLRRPR
ncbi:Vitamin B12 ABC transporter, permease component BtuC [Candidatus Paraburkholderia schumanniana]|nr:Vitamin B12 ABC transporter, permease component BtuC [Candidatus Paraburkholderia schumannianae]